MHVLCMHIVVPAAETQLGTTYPSGEHEFIPVFSGVRFAQFLVFCVVFLGSLFVFSSCFLWPSFVLRLLITPWVSSNFS